MHPYRLDHLPAMIRDDLQNYLREHGDSPAAKMPVRFGVDHGGWHVFLGQRPIYDRSGLGGTALDALKDFNHRRGYDELAALNRKGEVVFFNGSGT